MFKKLRQRLSNRFFESPTLDTDNPRARRPRHLRVENLEPRHLLTGGLTLQPLSSATLQAGAPLQIPINATDTGSNPVTYTVTSSNPAITASLPTGNPYLELNVTHTSSGAGDPAFTGTMVLELFANLAPTTVAQIVSLTNEGFYNGVVFNRVASSGGSPFVIQAGEPTVADAGITVPTINNEMNENLRYTSAGVLGMARTSADDTNNSQFFITGDAESFLDFQYTVFGRLVSGDNVRAEINAVPQDNSNGTGDGTPLSPVTITSATIISDPYDLALQVSAPLGTTGSSTITVSADDGHGGTDSQQFLVTISGDAADPGPFLRAITPPTTTVNNPVTFQLPFFDLNPTVNPPTFTNDTASNPNLVVSLDAGTGQMTVTPSNGLVGVQSLSVEVSSSVSQAPSTRTFPLFISPDAPMSVTLLSSSDTGANNSDGVTALNNSDGGHALQFEVDGVTSGDTVLLFDGSTQIGSAVASSTSVIITTDGTTVLVDGAHQITAKQVLPNQTYSVGNYNGTIDLTSPASAATGVTIDAAGPTFSTTPVTAAQAGQPYVYTAQANDSDASGLEYSVISGPSGFSIDQTTGIVTWTPTVGQIGTQSVQLRVTDLAGNTADQSFDVEVSLGPPVTVVSTTVPAHSAFMAGGVVPITVTFSAPVNVTGTPQLTLNDGAVVDYASGTGTATLTFNYTVGAGENTAQLDYASTSSLALNGGTIQDASSNDAVLTLPTTGTDGLAAQNIVIDNVAPTATVTSLTTNDTTPTITGTVADASPSGGIASVTIVVNGQTIGATVSGGTWSATVPIALVDGTYDVEVTAVDNAGNTFDTTTTGALTIDTVSPFVTGVSTTAAPNSTFNLGNSVSITIAFDENVTVTGTPKLTLNNGGVANYSSGSGTGTLTFVYTVAAGQSTADLDYASTTALALNGGTIHDTAGNAADLTLPATGTDGLATQHITINSPSLNADLSVSITSSSATTMIGGSVRFTITVTNNGPAVATGVSLTDTLPATLAIGTQVQTSGPAFALSNSGNAITDTIATLSSGASATFTVVAEVKQTVGVNTVMTDTVTVSSTSTDSTPANNTASASTTATVSGVVLTTDPFDATKTELMIGGTAGNDNINITMAAVGMVNVNMNGTLFGPFAVTGRIVAMGRLGNDVITVGPLVTLPTFLYSGLGNDTLTGGGGTNVLVGGGGKDVLVGGPGRNVLISGAGASQLYAAKLGVAVGSNSGSILIGGTTNFDQDDSALNTIMQEWGSNDAYATRVSKLRAGTLAGGVALTTTTIHQTAAIEQLYASSGGYDWFIAPSLTDQMLGIDPHKKSLLAFD